MTVCKECGVDFDEVNGEERCPVCEGSARIHRGDGLYLDISEAEYHNDPHGTPSLSSTIARTLVRESPAHAYLKHPKLGGAKFEPKTDMDRGTLLHKLLLGAGREVAVIECDDWKKPANRELRDIHREAGRIAVTRKLYEEALETAKSLKPRLAAKGIVFDGHSEVTLLWHEEAANGTRMPCRARLDHIKENHLYDLKITGDANPRTLRGGHITNMGYEIQTACYTSGASRVLPHLRGRFDYTLVFCEFEPPYSITKVRSAGSMRELGERRWRRAVNVWEYCTRTGEWPDYTGRDEIVLVEAKPWEMEEEETSYDAA
jgi:hypothetical protein